VLLRHLAFSSVLVWALASCSRPGSLPAKTASSAPPVRDSVEEARRFFASPNPDDRVKALGMMYRLADPALLPELEAGMTNMSEVIRKGCASALVRIGNDAIPILRNALTNRDWRVRNDAVVALGQMKDVGLFALLANMIDDSNERVRIAVTEAMAEIGGEDAAKFLIEAAPQQAPRIRIAICKALGKIGTDRALEALTRFFSDDYFFVRYEAAEAIVPGGDGAVPYLINTLKSSLDRRARALAARALGVIRSPDAVQPLLCAIEDTSPAVRRLAIWSLGNIGSMEAYGRLQEVASQGSWAERRDAQYALQNIARQFFIEQSTAVKGMY